MSGSDSVTLPIQPLDSYPKANPCPYVAAGVGAALEFQKSGETSSTTTIQDQFNLAGRVAIVTGGNSGIGLEYSVVLAELGATVYVLDITETPSSEFLACVEYIKYLNKSSKPSLFYVKADVTDENSIQPAIRAISQKHGGINIAVANAGISGPVIDCHKYPAPDFRKVLEVNVVGCFLTAQAAAQEMIANNITNGSIIFTASMSASIINRDMHWLPYNTSKGAVVQLSKGLACELGQNGIRVNTISPGHIRTKLTEKFLEQEPRYEHMWAAQNPMYRIGGVHEIRGVLAYLASDASSYTTGADILVCGGHTAW